LVGPEEFNSIDSFSSATLSFFREEHTITS